MNQDKYNLVKSKIIEAVPEIKESFKKFQEVRSKLNAPDSYEDFSYEFTLENVLLTLNTDCSSLDYAINIAGCFLQVIGTDKFNNLIFESTQIFWSLGKPLSEQSPELIDWLYKILK